MSFLNFEYLCLSFIFYGYCDTSSELRLYRETTIMRNRSRHLNVIFTEESRSKIECGIQCTLTCQSFSYNHLTSTCRGYDVTILDSASSVLEGGWRTYNTNGQQGELSTTIATTEPSLETITTTSATSTVIATTETTATTTTTTTTTATTTTTTTTTTSPQPSCAACPVGYTCQLSILFCYKYYGTRKSRTDAEALCAGEGAKLAIIDNAAKDNEILSYINSNSITEDFYWVQGRFISNEWRYDDGTLMTYFRWAPNHPLKDDLLAFNRNNGFHGTTDLYDDVYFCEVKL